MNSLIKKAQIAKFALKLNPVLLTAVRNHWNKDLKPAPYPKTEAERLKSAEKYLVHPAEYKAYPITDETRSYGDYPDLPRISMDAKDPNYPWDYPELKRNFNEPMHVEFDLLRDDHYDVNARYKYSIPVMYAQFLGFVGGAAVLFLLLHQVKAFHPLTPPQLPKDGKTHYTFETN